MTEEERAKREEEWSRQEAGRRAANLEWNRAALAAENEEMDKHPHDSRLPEPWTLPDKVEDDDIFDLRDRARSDDWKLAQRWHWADAVAWVAFGGPEIMPLLSACRSMFGRNADADPDTIERNCWEALKTRVDELSLDDAERVLREWCQAGLTTPVDGSGAPAVLPEHRRPYEAMLLAADIRRLIGTEEIAAAAPAIRGRLPANAKAADIRDEEYAHRAAELVRTGTKLADALRQVAPVDASREEISVQQGIRRTYGLMYDREGRAFQP